MLVKMAQRMAMRMMKMTLMKMGQKAPSGKKEMRQTTGDVRETMRLMMMMKVKMVMMMKMSFEGVFQFHDLPGFPCQQQCGEAMITCKSARVENQWENALAHSDPSLILCLV